MASKWLSQGSFTDYYPASKNSINYYAVFSPAIDRFLIVDNTCPWIVFKTSQILSSKISTVTFILNQSAEPINNENCLNYGTAHKKEEHTFGGSNPNNHKQSAIMHPFYNNEVVEKGWPEEWDTEERKEVLFEIQEYALFVLKVVQSIKIAYSFRNIYSDSHYLEEFFIGQYPKNFTKTFDGTESPIGMYREITNILYHSEYIDDALEQINLAWKKYSELDVAGMRELFYKCLGIEIPNFNFDQNKISQDYTIWVV